MIGGLKRRVVAAARCSWRSLSSAHRQRRPDLATLTPADVNWFIRNIGNDAVVQEPEDVAAFNRDWMGKYVGSGRTVLRPSSTEQVSDILKYCNDRRIAIVPQGGNTGLVGGSVPVHDEIVLSMSRMNRIIEVDESAHVIVCEAGCILETLDVELGKVGLTMPLDLGAKGTCQIGGNVATNAGGIRLLRYGSMHANVLGIEAVLPGGSVLDNLVKLRKDNTGYDIKQLLIGSEGTLGVITKVAVLAATKPTSVQLAFLGSESFENVLKVLKLARQELGEILSAAEFQDRSALESVISHLPGAVDPLRVPHRFYIIIESSGFSDQSDATRMNNFLAKAMDLEFITDGTLAQDTVQFQSLWKLRESVAEALSKQGRIYKYDISIPVQQMYSVVEIMRKRLGGHISADRICGYGHIGDSNLHLNISAEEYSEEIESLIEPFIYELTASMKGSISAEHGLGVMKADCIGYSKTFPLVNLMQSVKNVFDPNGILNPYKVLPDSASNFTHPLVQPRML